MTRAEKLQEINDKFIQWSEMYRTKQLISNPARIIGEAICKAIILNLKGDSRGTTIIEGDDPAIPLNFPGRQVGQELSFSQLIQAVNQIGGFNRGKKMKDYLQLIQGLTNPGSHSANNGVDVVKAEDMANIFAALSELLKWLYTIRLNLPIPELLTDSMDAVEESLDDSSDVVAWNKVLSACHEFSNRRQFILVSPSNLTTQPEIAASIARLPWRLVLDFDPQTDMNVAGLLCNFEKQKGASYKRSFTIEDKLEFDPGLEHYWFHANGLGHIPSFGTFKEWKYKYKSFLGSKLYSAFSKGLRALPRTVVLINMESEYAEAVIDELERQAQDEIEFVLLNNGNFNYERIHSTFQHVTEIPITTSQLSKGINNNIWFSLGTAPDRTIKIPFKNEIQSQAFAEMKTEDYHLLQSLGIELIYKGVEREVDGEFPPDNFYKGGMISWSDIVSQRDITRHNYEILKNGLLTELEKNKSKEIEFIHAPGAGGTTIARRLAYDICDKFPTVCLRKYEPKKTLNGLRIIYDSYINSSVPILIIIEHHEMKLAHLLYRDLGNVSKNAILFVVKRGAPGSAKDARYTLRGSLAPSEIPAFESLFAHQMPHRRQALLDIKKGEMSTQREIPPFLYGLVAYEHEFIGLNEYINKCLEDLNVQKRKLIGFVCLIYHYTQQAVPGEFFADLFNTSWEKCDLFMLLGQSSSVFDILYENTAGRDGENTWRPRYAILGFDAMRIILTGSTLRKENYKSHLGHWLIDLIGYVSRSVHVLNDDAKNLFDALFITRGDFDNTDGRDQFTEVISDLDPSAGQAVFEALIEAYPDEAHYHGHFARYLYKPEKGIRQYDRAIEAANRSLEIQPNDPSLVHTLGMCYKEKAESKMNELSQGIADQDLYEYEVRQLVELACETFDRSIALNGDNVFGHVTQTQLILKTLEFGYQLSGAYSREQFVTNPENDWYESLLEKAGDLLDEAAYIIQQSRGLDIKTRLAKSIDYVERCNTDYLIKIGETSVAQSKYENLIKKTPAGYQYMVPRYKTLFIRCLLASKTQAKSGYSRAWHLLSESQLIQCVGYLRENIFAEPNNSNHIRMWLQAVRYLKLPPSLEESINMVAMWSQIENQTRNAELESLYYLYVLHAVKAISEGASFDRSSVNAVMEIRDRLRSYPKNEKFSFEWYGNGNGLHKMKNHHELGSFESSTFFTRNAHKLVEVYGRIKQASDWQRGKIILDCGLEAFFVPGLGTFTEKNENERVKFYIGFRYDQINAWNVVPADDPRNVIPFNEPLSQAIDVKNEPQEEDDEVFEMVSIKKVSTPTVEITSLKYELAKPTVLDKIELPDAKKVKVKASSSVDSKSLNAQTIYNGTIERLRQPKGIIKFAEAGLYISFHTSALRKLKFQQLKYGLDVSFRIKFENGVPKKDKDGKNYVAADVYPKTK